MNPNAPRGVAEPLGEVFPFDSLPERWDPQTWTGNGTAYFEGVRRYIRSLVLADQEQHPERPNNYQGHAVLRVLSKLIRSSKRGMGIPCFGGVAFTDPNGVYAIAMRAMQQELIRWANRQDRRIIWTTGGGPGFAMSETCSIFRQTAEDLKCWNKAARILHVLVNMQQEAPNTNCPDEFIIRAQADLAQRAGAMLVPASACVIIPHGLGGNDERAQVMLDNQLCGRGPNLIGARAAVFMDCKIDEQACEAANLPHGTRFFDFLEWEHQILCASGTASPDDWRLYIRVSVDDDPERAGRHIGQELARWQEMRIDSGVDMFEFDAVAAALESLG